MKVCGWTEDYNWAMMDDLEMNSRIDKLILALIQKQKNFCWAIEYWPFKVTILVSTHQFLLIRFSLGFNHLYSSVLIAFNSLNQCSHNVSVDFFIFFPASLGIMLMLTFHLCFNRKIMFLISFKILRASKEMQVMKRSNRLYN